MRRWLYILLGVPVGLGFLFWSVAEADGENIRLGGAYAGVLTGALSAYVQEHPDALARSGYQNTEAPPRPCDPLSAEGRGPYSYQCAALSYDGNSVPAWLRPMVPLKVMVRITPRVWADPGARALLLNLVQSKAAACATLRADAVIAYARGGSMHYRRPERYGLGCDKRQPPNHQVWFNITAARGFTCVHPDALSTRCDKVKVDDSRAFRVR
jgi:hypothetical protein